MIRKLALLTAFCFSLAASIYGEARTLYYQQAQNVVLTNNTEGHYLLSVVGLDEKTLLFDSDLTGADSITTVKFFDKWSTYGYDATPPIAAIINGKNKSLSFKLKEPQYDMTKRAVHYVVEPQEEIEVSLMNSNWGKVAILFERSHH